MNRQMKTLRKAIIKDIQTKIKDAFILFNRLKWLPYLPDFSVLGIQGTFSYHFGDITFVFPWIEADWKMAKRAVLVLGWKVYSENEQLESYSSSKTIHFSHPAITKDLQWFTLRMKSRLEGSTCVVTQIGEEKEIKEVVTPIFEVTCEEGAEEQVFV